MVITDLAVPMKYLCPILYFSIVQCLDNPGDIGARLVEGSVSKQREMRAKMFYLLSAEFKRVKVRA